MKEAKSRIKVLLQSQDVDITIDSFKDSRSI